jgi:uncharacterized protein YwqG
MTDLIYANFSAELEQFRDQIEASVKPYIHITPTENEALNLWQSKFGGLPYLPKDCEYPRDNKGNPLFLLAQINLAEMPELEGFPEEGILQFYIADADDYGLDFDNPKKQDRFRVLYFPEVSKSEGDLITDFSFLPSPELLPFVYGMACSLVFQQNVMPVTVEDFQFQTLLGDDFLARFGEKEEEIIEEYVEKFEAEGHRVGGYPLFTQEDPRTNLKGEEEYRLLLQIDTDPQIDLMWGDSGVANFFMTQTDLDNLDFSKVLFHWDCH